MHRTYSGAQEIHILLITWELFARVNELGRSNDVPKYLTFQDLEDISDDEDSEDEYEPSDDEDSEF